MCECDADLEMVPSHLLIPLIEHWQMIRRIRRNAQTF